MATDLSDVSICSSALIKLGNEPITSLDDDNKNARFCKNRYSQILASVIEAHTWSFATQTVELAPLAGVAPVMDWTYAFQLPADLLKMLRGEDLFQDFEMYDGRLYADDNPLKIKYLFLNTNVSSYTYAFAECVAWRLAADLAYALTNSTVVAQSMMTGYQMQLKEARYNDSHKSTPQPLVADEYIRSRF